MMKIEQIYTGCLAQGAYYIQSKGEAVVIDPLREVTPYLKKAANDGAKITYVLETHFHADFVSGHIDLAEKSGAQIVYGPTAQPGFEASVLADGTIIEVGDLKIQVIHTPGHTMESTCYLLFNEKGKAVALFTGDTLFIGDVGRPDLAQKVVPDLTMEKLAGHLYDSLTEKILPLPDDLLIYPAHGAGSACGKNMRKETTDTLGNQKRTNYALQPMSKSLFIQRVTEGLVPPPAYFPENVLMNIRGYQPFDTVLGRGLRPLTPEAFEKIANEESALMLDTRAAEDFARSFIPNAIHMGIDGNFAPWAGALIPDIQQKILLITDEGREEEAVTRLARVGYDYAIGFLKGGMKAWEEAGKEIDRIEIITATELAYRMKTDTKLKLIDVRKKSEFDSEHVLMADNKPLDTINEHLTTLHPDETYYLHCAGGYRSMIFNSIARARGYHHLVDVQGGMKAIKETNAFAISEYHCPSTML